METLMLQPWDYLIVTASNDLQAQAYQEQLALRQRLGLLPHIGQTLVVADPQGKRVGSGGSTLYCLMRVLQEEMTSFQCPAGAPHGNAVLDALSQSKLPSSRKSSTGLPSGAPLAASSSPPSSTPRPLDPSTPSPLTILQQLRILIIHAGGDSRRLPAYGPCGKIFIPVPGSSSNALTPTLFDRLLETFQQLTPGRPGQGQIVVTSGDALIRFDPSQVDLALPGLVAMGALATPEAASKHGVFCVDPNNQARRYLQKPQPDVQAQAGAINAAGQAILDIGVMSLDAATAVAMLQAFHAQIPSWPPRGPHYDAKVPG